MNEILLKKIGRELREWIYLGIRAGMVNGVAAYNQLKVVDPNAAQLEIERAVDLPHRARARINAAITKYGQQQIVDALSSSGSVNIAALNAELTSLETYAQGLVDRRLGGESWDSIATDIEANVPREAESWNFPIPVGYKDIWGK